MKRFVCVLTAFLTLLLSQAVPVNAMETAPKVIEVDIGIAPADYDRLISEDEKTQYSVFVSMGGRYLPAAVNIRGNSSKIIGLFTEAKRIPLELTYQSKKAFDAGMANEDIKLISCLTLYRLITEYVALDLFQWMGIPTPAHTFAFVRFNGVDFGLYIAVEDINGSFLSKWYPGAKGVAYKATTDREKSGSYVISDWFGTLFQKTGRESDTLTLLLTALDNEEVFETYINADEWLRFFACVAATGGEGSLLTERNNFVLYDNGGKFDLIPWDLSEAFAGRETGDGIDRYCIDIDTNKTSPLFDLLMKQPGYREKYYAYIREITEGFLAPAAMDLRYAAVLDALQTYLPRDHSIFLNHTAAMDELRSDEKNSKLNLLYMFHGVYENLMQQLNGTQQTFFVNESYLDFDSAMPIDRISSLLKENSPLYDPTLPQKITDAYPAWQKAHQEENSNVFLWIILLSAIVVGLIVVASAVGKRKKKP